MNAEGVVVSTAEMCSGTTKRGRRWSGTIYRYEVGDVWWLTGKLARWLSKAETGDSGGWSVAEAVAESPSGFTSHRAVIDWFKRKVDSYEVWPWVEK